MRFALLCLVIAATGSLAIPVEDEIHLYRRTYLSGPPTPVRLTSSECVEISSKLHGEVNSIDTRGKCVELWSKSGCQGVSSRISPGTKHHLDLRLTIVKNHVKSLTTCNSNLRQSNGNVIVYQGKHYRGISQELNVGPGECANLNANMRRAVSSVKAGKACILLWSRPDCSGDYGQIEVEEKKQYNLAKINFITNSRLSVNDNTESISLCDSQEKNVIRPVDSKYKKPLAQSPPKMTYLDYFDAVNEPLAAEDPVAASTYDVPPAEIQAFSTYNPRLIEVEKIVSSKTQFTSFNPRHQDAVNELVKIYQGSLIDLMQNFQIKSNLINLIHILIFISIIINNLIIMIFFHRT